MFCTSSSRDIRGSGTPVMQMLSSDLSLDEKIGVSRIVLSAFGRPQFIHPFGTRLLSCTPRPEGVLRRLFR